MMETNAIIGLDSAYICAQETGSGNMQISAGLVVELIDRLRAAEAERQELHHAQNSLLDRLSDLTAYKEAAEKQDPAGRVKIEDSWCGGGEFHAQIDEDLPDGTLLYAKPVSADKPARITEQDAMAILLEWDAYRAERSASGVTPAHFKKWLSLVGRGLIAKLNADRCPSHESEQKFYGNATTERAIDVVVRSHESEQHSFGKSEFIPVDLLLKPDLTDEDVEKWRKQNNEAKVAALDEAITMLRRKPLPDDPFIKSGFSEAIAAVVTMRNSINQEGGAV